MAKSSQVQIPHSTSTVDVQVIDNGTWLSDIAAEWAMTPIYPGLETFACPSYSFLITHQASGKKVLYDLALRKDYEQAMNPGHLQTLKGYGIGIRVKEDVSDVLEKGGTDLSSVIAIIWSHHHWDHVGNPSRFPPSTKVVVGPGFSKAFLPGYPTDPKGEVMSDAFSHGRELQEIDFSSGLKIGQYRAHDYFNDGSLYLLDTPGHTVGHISALVRSTSSGSESTFIFLGGDIVHHNAVFRPTSYLPLPESITPSPLEKAFHPTASSCPCTTFSKIHRLHSSEPEKTHTEPFGILAGPDHDLEEARKSAEKMFEFDGDENVFTIFAHDISLMDVIDFFPKSVSGWKEKGWKRESHWRFLTALIPEGHELHKEGQK